MNPLADLARRAYAIGWARSGGPMTDRVRAGCLAAVELALAHADRPHVIEATLHLGHLEGIWADLYRRRDNVTTHNHAAVGKAWTALLGHLDRDRLIRGLARRLGVTPNPTEADQPDLKHGADRAALAAVALGALQNLEHTDPDEWADLRQAVRDAVATGRAEGAAQAVALTVKEQTRSGVVRTDFGLAFEDAYRNLEHIAGLWTEADDWIRTLLGYAAGDIGRTLAAGARDDWSYEDIRDAVASYLDDPDTQALDVAINQLTGRALSQGSLDLYRQAGVGEVDFLTAGDSRVDRQCDNAETSGPYTPDTAPVPPLHAGCRCTLAPRSSPTANLSRYLTTSQEGA